MPNASYDERDDEKLDTDTTEIEKGPVQKPIPSVLQKRQAKQLFFSFVSAIAVIAASIWLRNARLLFALVLPLYALYQALMISVNYRADRIIELVLICTSVSKAAINDRLNVTFKTIAEDSDESNGALFEFTVPGKGRADQFIVGSPYVVYLDKTAPHILLDYFPC